MALAPRWFEDFTVGLRFRSAGEVPVTAERIKSFAAEFDPQPCHLDDQGGGGASFGGLVASGWHTAAVAMRLIVDSDLGLAGQGGGIAVESLRWPLPVRAGDSLRAEGTVTQTRASRSHADRGIVKFQTTVYNQRGEAVLEATHVVMALRRGASPIAG
jgi:acyl dehydratase